jgi:hypothetical protein
VTTDERLDRLTKAVDKMQEDTEAFKREVRQGFQVLTELHADTQREMAEMRAETKQGFLKLANSMSALADAVAQHETRIDRLEGK